MQQLGNVGERAEMILKLARRDKKQNNPVNGLVIKRIEINSILGATKGANNIRNKIRGSVRNADTKANSRGHGRFAFLDSLRDGVEKIRFDLAGRYEAVDQFVNGLPPIISLRSEEHTSEL